MKNRIPYTQTWEDTDILRRALVVQPDDRVLTVTAAGGAPVAVLSDHPHQLVSIDRNPDQTRLVKLIAAAAEALSYKEFLAFIGIHDSRSRANVYQHHVLPIVDPNDRQFWNTRLKDIAQGIIHTGRLERYFQFFSRYILPLLVSRKNIHQILQAQSLEEQSALYRRVWNTWRWRLGLKFFYGKQLLHQFGRDYAFRKYAHDSSGSIYAQRAFRGLTEIPVHSNWLIEYILTGRYQQTIPPYFRHDAWHFWQRLRHDGQLITQDVVQALPPLGTFTKVHLSDIFEGFSDRQFRDFFAVLGKHVSLGGRVCFWINLANPPIVDLPKFGFRILQDESSKLWNQDNGFMYGNFFILERIG